MAHAQGPEGMSQEELVKLPGVEDTFKFVGKKDGEIRLFRNGNTPEAFVWKEVERKWEKIGEVIS